MASESEIVNRASENEIVNWVTLFAIQIVGVSIAFVSVLHLRLAPFTNITPGPLMTLMLWAVGVTAVLTVCLIVLTPGIGSSLWSATFSKWDAPAFLTWLTFSWAISLCALINFVGLGVLIYATGGSRQTMYVPYLFTIVLLIIMLDAPKKTIIGCFALTVIIFLGCLFCHNENFEVTIKRTYDIYFGIIIGLCVLFPTLVKIFNI